MPLVRADVIWDFRRLAGYEDLNDATPLASKVGIGKQAEAVRAN